MSASSERTKDILKRVLRGRTIEEAVKDFNPRSPREFPLPGRIPAATDHTEKGLQRRRDLLQDQSIHIHQLVGEGKEIDPADLAGNIENFLGFARAYPLIVLC